MKNETEELQQLFRDNRWGDNPEFLTELPSIEQRKWEAIPVDPEVEAKLLAVTEMHQRLTKFDPEVLRPSK